MCSVCLAEEPNKSTDKPVEGPVEGPNAKTDETDLQSSESKQDLVNIPLDQIWALDMPGTRDVRDLEPDFSKQRLSNKEMIHRSMIEQIRRAHNANHWPKGNENAGPGFVVEGIDLESLTQARDVFLEKQKRYETFPAGTDFTIVFYAYETGVYVHLDKVIRDDNIINVHYHFTTHSTAYVTSHFALIPVGKLPPGSYQIKMVQRPVQAQPGDGWASTTPVKPEFVDRFVCKSFQFEVTLSK